tara:strand:- start:8591 stop:9091 length:501 start_codon:yes stop_codon:yes gene_type:complete
MGRGWPASAEEGLNRRGGGVLEDHEATLRRCLAFADLELGGEVGEGNVRAAAGNQLLLADIPGFTAALPRAAEADYFVRIIGKAAGSGGSHELEVLVGPRAGYLPRVALGKGRKGSPGKRHLFPISSRPRSGRARRLRRRAAPAGGRKRRVSAVLLRKCLGLHLRC